MSVNRQNFSKSLFHSPVMIAIQTLLPERACGNHWHISPDDRIPQGATSTIKPCGRSTFASRTVTEGSHPTRVSSDLDQTNGFYHDQSGVLKKLDIWEFSVKSTAPPRNQSGGGNRCDRLLNVKAVRRRHTLPDRSDLHGSASDSSGGQD